MLPGTMRTLQGSDIHARDGRAGSLDDLYFDDRQWMVRHLVVDTGTWLPGRRVLLPPQSVVPGGDAKPDAIGIALTRQEVCASPGSETDPPASELYAQVSAAQYGNRGCWEGLVLLNDTASQFVAPFGAAHPDAGAANRVASAARAARRSHLCSCRDLLGCRVTTAGGSCGRVQDLAVDAHVWAIVNVIVEAHNRLSSMRLEVPPRAIERIDWVQRSVRVALTSEEVDRGPAAA